MLKSFAISASLIVLAGAVYAPANRMLNQEASASTSSANLYAVEVIRMNHEQTADIIKETLADANAVKYTDRDINPAVMAVVERAYANNGFMPIWNSNGAGSFEIALTSAASHGIDLGDDSKAYIKELFSLRQNANATVRAQTDIEISLAWLQLAQTYSGNALNNESKAENAATQMTSFTQALVSAGQGDSAAELEAMAPTQPQYQGLVEALNKYNVLAAMGGWPQVTAGEALEPGDTDPRIPEIRNRLALEGFMSLVPAQDNMNAYDVRLEQSVKSFQSRHGLEADGIIGSGTFEAMNESAESKVARISESLHRWRALGTPGDRYIWANLPSYTAEAYDGDQREIQMRTIVGKTYFATPTFSDEVEYMVANPKWFVPVSIARRQKLPQLRKDPGYAARHNYEIYDRATGAPVDAYNVDWSDNAAARKYQFVQQSGSNNALGEMKIIFPNQYSIYLHGTPDKHLFAKTQRAFSSGCVRLEDPVKMANWLASKDSGASVETINTAMANGERVRIPLSQQVPVHVTYMSVTVEDNGDPVFWRDMYKRVESVPQMEIQPAMFEDYTLSY